MGKCNWGCTKNSTAICPPDGKVNISMQMHLPPWFYTYRAPYKMCAWNGSDEERNILQAL